MDTFSKRPGFTGLFSFLVPEQWVAINDLAENRKRLSKRVSALQAA